MNKASSHHAPCAICKSRPADKTNSHIIPSFFISMVASVDHSYKRDRELLYTIRDHFTTAYIGRSVKEEDLKKSFDSLTDERIAEMTKQTDSKDYIFCPHCEKKLGEYLESPWHDHLFNGKRISPDVAYFFWVSLLWRISAYESVAFKLPTHIEELLRKRLNAFIQAKDSNEDTSPLLNKAPFKYKVLYCKNYSKQNAGVIHCNYDRKSKIATLILGDVAACFSFHKRGSFDKHSFYGLENAFLNAPVNDGCCEEVYLKINASVLEAFNTSIIPVFQTIRMKSDIKKVMWLWIVAKEVIKLPLPQKPDDEFVRFVISQRSNESVKTGERIAKDYIVKCFVQGLVKFYSFPNNPQSSVIFNP